MSNYLVIATVTAAFGRIVAESLERVPEPSGSPRVRYGPPQNDPQFVGCTLFAYRIGVNAFLRNADTATRDSLGRFIERPTVPLEISYLLTFHGDEATLEPQRFAGSALAAIHARPQLDVAEIKRMTEGIPYLRESDLSAGLERVKLVPSDLDGAALAQVWGMLSGVPLQLAVGYTATTVLLESDVTPRTIPPVKDVAIAGGPVPGKKGA
jgi:hypothetical protein